MGQPQQAVPQTTVKAEDDRIKNKLLQAKRAFDIKHYYDAAKYAKEVHDIDCTNQEAWIVYVQAEALRNPQYAASTLAQSRQYIEDEKVWRKILDNIRPALLQAEFSEYSAEPAVKLLSIDGEFGSEYVAILLENAAKKIKEYADHQRNRFAEHQRKRPPLTPSDNADLVSMERNFVQCLLAFQKIIKALGELLAACEQKGLKLDEAFEKPFGQMQAFFDDAEKFQRWTSKMDIVGGVKRELQFRDCLEPFITADSQEYHALKREYQRAIAPIEKKLQQARQNAVDKYWQENRAKKERLEQEQKDARKQIEQLRQKEKALISDGTDRDLSGRIRALQQEHDRLGFFKGKQKQAIQERIAQLQTQLSKWEKENALAKDTVKRQMTTMCGRLEEIYKTLQNPLE
jgi:hypothetical protein